MRDPSAVEAAVEGIVGSHGRLDALVNNAGIQRHGALERLSFADWQDVLDVNLNGALHCLQSAGRRMLAQGTSRADAAFACGFADQRHLNSQFRRAFGDTPGRWGAPQRQIRA